MSDDLAIYGEDEGYVAVTDGTSPCSGCNSCLDCATPWDNADCTTTSDVTLGRSYMRVWQYNNDPPYLGWSSLVTGVPGDTTGVDAGTSWRATYFATVSVDARAKTAVIHGLLVCCFDKFEVPWPDPVGFKVFRGLGWGIDNRPATPAWSGTDEMLYAGTIPPGTFAGAAAFLVPDITVSVFNESDVSIYLLMDAPEYVTQSKRLLVTNGPLAGETFLESGDVPQVIVTYCDTNATPPTSGQTFPYSGTSDGTTTLLDIGYPYLSGTTKVTVNGVLMVRSKVYRERDPAAGTIEWMFVPPSGAEIRITAEAA